MAKRKKPLARTQARCQTSHDRSAQTSVLKGWKQIAEFLGQPVAVPQRWAGEGMPVTRGRYVETSPDQLSRWLGRESGTKEPVHIATDDADLSADLKRGLAELRRHKRQDR
jgi:hypothetical protein